jgi:hypothetical protein
MNKIASDKGIFATWATWDEMSFPDWEQRLRQAQQESSQGKGISLDTYLKRRARC